MSTDEPPPRELSPWIRALVTASAPLVVWAAGAIPLPHALDLPSFVEEHGEAPVLSAAMLGISPLVTASAIHELISLVAPSRRRTRVAGPAGFARHVHSTLFLAVLLAAFQAYGIVRVLEAGDLLATAGLLPTLVVVITLVAGFALLVVAAMALGRFGLVNGAFAILCAEVVLGMGPLPASLSQAALDGTWRGPVAAVTAAVLTVLVTLVALAPATRSRALPEASASPGPAYRASHPARPGVVVEAPALPAGLLPVAAAGALVALPSVLGDEPVMVDTLAASLLAALLLSLVLGLAFARPSALARLWSRAAGPDAGADDLAADARAAASWAIARGALFALAVTALGSAMPLPGLSAPAIALLTAVIADAVAAARRRRADTSWIDVWPEPRPAAVGPALEALARHGVPAFAGDRRLAALFPLVGPVAPTRIVVPSGDALRAREVLASVLPAEPVPMARPRDEESTSVGAPASAPTRSAVPLALGAGRRATIGALAATFVLALGLAHIASLPPPLEPGVPPARLAVVLVNDDPGEAQRFFDAVAEDLPRGGRIATEMAPLGPERVASVPYLLVIADEGEDLGATLARARDWAHAHPLPAGGLGFGPFDEEDESGRLVPIGHRSYVLAGAPLLTEADVARATAELGPSGMDASLALELTPEGAARFADATRRNARRRLAFVVDGVVTSAPVVQGEIGGGAVRITMPAGAPDEQLAAAKRLASALDPRARADR